MSVYFGDCSKIMQQLEASSVDLIVTDPPYMAEEIVQAYTRLADESPRLMKSNASLITLVGHFAIDQVVKIFDGKLKYNWLVVMLQPKYHRRMSLGVEVTFKPILWYVKSSRFIGARMPDSFVVEGSDGYLKPLHPWQQDLSYPEFFINNLTKPGDLVLDPFMGSGTTLVAAKKLGRRAIGIDIDAQAVLTAISRLEVMR